MKTNSRKHGLSPHDPRRCQAIERRVVNDRDRLKRSVHTVQCTLLRHGDEIEHEWMGRKFGTPTKRPMSGPQKRRCPNTEIRELDQSRARADQERRQVRCSRDVNHDGKCAWRGREFGAPVKTSSGASGAERVRRHRARVKAARALQESGALNDPSISVEELQRRLQPA